MGKWGVRGGEEGVHTCESDRSTPSRRTRRTVFLSVASSSVPLISCRVDPDVDVVRSDASSLVRPRSMLVSRFSRTSVRVIVLFC